MKLKPLKAQKKPKEQATLLFLKKNPKSKPRCYFKRTKKKILLISHTGSTPVED